MKKTLVVIAVLSGAAQMSFGSLILQSLIPLTGTGLGTEPTILTIQSPNNSSSEIGCVGATSTQIGATLTAGGVCTGVDHTVLTGAGQIGPQTLGAGLITTGAQGAADFAIVFNAAEPSGNGITLTSLRAVFYTSAGTFLYETGQVLCPQFAGSICAFPTTVAGTGGAGYLFQLDAAQQAAAVTAGAFSSTSNIVGLQAAADDATGGNETFFLGSNPRLITGAVSPEPGTLLTMLGGLGLAGLGALRRKSKV